MSGSVLVLIAIGFVLPVKLQLVTRWLASGHSCIEEITGYRRSAGSPTNNMRQQLRLALPPLSDLAPDTNIAFVLIDREGRIARAGQLPLAELGAGAGSVAVHALLHPNDAVVAAITVPPLPPQQPDAPVAGVIEPKPL